MQQVIEGIDITRVTGSQPTSNDRRELNRPGFRGGSVSWIRPR
jgi:hypothetical protein